MSPSPRQSPRAPAAPEARPSLALPAVILVLALAGVAVAADLWVIHHEVHAGATSVFCDFTAHVSCTDVARSPYSTLLGVPLAAFGLLSYLAVAALSASAFLPRRAGPSFPGGLLTLLTGLMSLLAVGLALVSELLIHAVCIMCSASWIISFALLALSIALSRRAGGLLAALRADLSAIRTRPRPFAAGLAALVLAAAGLLIASAVAKAQPVGNKPGVPPVVTLPIGPPGSLVVYEYSDYLCPFCARVHSEEKAILARRPDLRIVKRQFPLDASCNQRLTRTVHEGSCDLARGGICAEKQGRFEAYEDAAFASQDTKPDVEALAAQCGLDGAAFKACLDSPDTESRLKADIKDGMAAGVSGTPSFQYQGKLLKGGLPPELGGTPAK